MFFNKSKPMPSRSSAISATQALNDSFVECMEVLNPTDCDDKLAMIQQLCNDALQLSRLRADKVVTSPQILCNGYTIKGNDKSIKIHKRGA